MAIKKIELYFLSIIKGEKTGFTPALLRFLLWMGSFPYRLAVNTRNWLFDHGFFRSYIPPIPLVISVGNITVGGTGKTPVTLMIAEALNAKNSLAVLSRGYRSQAENSSSPIILHKSQGIMHPASLCGDEPYLIAENLPESYVIVGKDRSLASKVAARLGVEAIILDDGMQHRSIARDLEVVVMDLLDPFGQGHFLPRGLLREDKKALGRADLIILNHSSDHQKFEQVKRQISSATTAPVVGTKIQVTGVFDLKENPLTFSPKTRVGIFCGIAHPEYFRTTILQMEGEIIGELFFRDHDTFDLEELMKFSADCKKAGADFLICTEKDRVKMIDPGEFMLPISWVKTKLHVTEGLEHWNAFVNHAKMSLGPNSKGKR